MTSPDSYFMAILFKHFKISLSLIASYFSLPNAFILILLVILFIVLLLLLLLLFVLLLLFLFAILLFIEFILLILLLLLFLFQLLLLLLLFIQDCISRLIIIHDKRLGQNLMKNI